jgi:hypothetical protein
MGSFLRDGLRASSRLAGVLALGAAMLCALGPTPGCGGDGGDGDGGAGGKTGCPAGQIDVEGSCRPKCDPAKCFTGNVCVGNTCRVQCDADAQCLPGTQSCFVTQTDDDKAVQVCLENGHHVPLGKTGPAPAGWGAPCPFGTECTTAAGDGTAAVTACPNGLECDLAACSGQPAECKRDDATCDAIAKTLSQDPAKFLCNIGRCENADPKDTCDRPDPAAYGSCTVSGRACLSNADCGRCAVLSCPPEQCSAFFCQGAGEGDAAAYCAHHDCASDAECPTGFHCANTRDPHDVCGPVCMGNVCSNGLVASCTKNEDCYKGNNFLCGQTAEPCIDPTQPQADGKQLFEGPLCMMRRTCLKREECDPCKNSLDCARGSGDLCVTHGEETVCARFCANDDPATGVIEGDQNCRPDHACVPTGGSTCKLSPHVSCATVADCPPVLDKCVSGACEKAPAETCTLPTDCPAVDAAAAGEACVPRSVCLPRSGSCHAKNAAPGQKFCHHCVDDTDCANDAAPAELWACRDIGQGQKGCINQQLKSCTTDNDCDKSPSGDPGECLDEGEGLGPGDAAYHRCWFPYNAVKKRFGCFPNSLP